MKTNILILGSGIGGYQAYKTIAQRLRGKNAQQTITVVDQNNYFTFTPLLHEVATGSVEPTHCAIPLRGLMNSDDKFIRATVQQIDPIKQEVQTDVGTINYDYCVVALGSKINFFSTPGAAAHAHHVRTLQAAMRLQEAIVNALESCETELALTVVGGAYTGVEIAGQLSHFIQSDIKKLYPHKKVTVTLIQATDSIIPTLPEKNSYLRK
jgi:NADH dehydrogenase